jgi:hypothetical protein
VQIGARTPEELAELLEDAFIVGDQLALAALFEPLAVVAVAGRLAEAHGHEIAAALADVWNEGASHAPGPRRVVQAGRIALVVAYPAIAVMRRTPEGCWRYAIALFTNNKEGDS